MSKLTTTWWIVFYKDQLLLKKQNNKLTIPCNEQPPLPIPADTHVHEICILEGQPCKAFVVSHPIEESDEYCMTGLRASYDFIPLQEKLSKYYIGISIAVSARYVAQKRK